MALKAFNHSQITSMLSFTDQIIRHNRMPSAVERYNIKPSQAVVVYHI